MPLVTKDDLHSIDWEISSACQATCPVCLRRDPTALQMADVDQGYTTLREFKRALKYTTGIKAINFCGNIGDPMTNPEIADIAEYIVRTQPGCQVRVSTNGGIGSVESYERLAAAGVTMTFGIDGYRDVNNWYRAGVKWEAVDRNIRAFRKNVSGLWQLTLQFLAFDQNIHDLPNVIAWARDVGVNTLHVKESYGPARIAVQDRNDQHTHTLTKLNTEQYRPLINQIYPAHNWDQLLDNWTKLNLAEPVIPEVPKSQPLAFNRPGREQFRFPEGAPYEIYQTDMWRNAKTQDVHCISWDDIERRNKKVLFIFITYDLYVMPCCFISGRFTGNRMTKGLVTQQQIINGEPRQLLDTVDAEMLNKIHEIGVDKFSLRRYSLGEILDSGVLNQLVYQDLETDNKLAICGKFCKKCN
jgi:MoaA/NifB/PqqE/SkfB family radical SAM enzyme